MAATNRPWDLDSAFLRRFERKIYAPLPDVESREAIFAYHTRGIEKAEGVDFRELAEITDGYSGSDIAIVCREVIMRPIRELDKSGSLEGDADVNVRPINREDFDKALRKIRPTVSDEEIQRFQLPSNDSRRKGRGFYLCLFSLDLCSKNSPKDYPINPL